MNGTALEVAEQFNGNFNFVFMFKVVISLGMDLVKKSPNSDCQVLSIIYFFNFFISMLFYLGAMQWLVVKLGWLLQVFMYSMRKIK